MLTDNYNIFQYGNSALCIEFSKDFTESAWLKTHRLAEELDLLNLDGMLNIIPTYTSIVIHFDVYIISALEVKQHIVEIIKRLEATLMRKTKKYKIPVVYGGIYGPDLSRIANQVKLTETEIIHLHCKEPSSVLCFTSPAGQPLMHRSSLPDSVTRVEVPYTKIPIGSVGVVGRQSTVYSRESPGGWNLIGRTPINMTIPTSFPPTPVLPGDSIEFFEISQNEWDFYKNKTIKDLQGN